MKTGPKPRLLKDRFLEKVRYIQGNDCWIWHGQIRPDGYGVFYVNESGRKEYAHRVSYNLHKGAIEKGKVIDHVCRTRYCVNPDHLEVVTHKENSMRSPIMGNPQKKNQTHCIHGHPLAGNNLYISPNSRKRVCITCRNERKRKLKQESHEDHS